MVFSLATALAGQPPPPSTAAPDVNSLLPRLRAVGQKALNRGLPDNDRLEAMQDLGNDSADTTLRFLVAAFAVETSPLVRRAVIGSIAESNNPRRAGFLDLLSSQADPDSQAFIQAHLAKQRQESSSGLLAAAAAAPPIAVPGVTDRARFLVIGDFGTPDHGQTDIQEQVSVALKRFRTQEPGAQFGITVGDNFYPFGVLGANDPRWTTDWENLYGPLSLTFYAALGNHDHYGGPASVDGEVRHQSPSWQMPDRYYSFVAGKTELFAIDSEKILGQPAQMAWLEAALARSTANWRIVYGHHPVVSGGQHGINGELRQYYDKLLPVLVRNHVDLYVTGHDHDLQMLKVEGLYQPVVGGSGKDSESVAAVHESLFCSADNGFAYIETSDLDVRIRLLRAPDAAAIYDCTVHRDAQTNVLTDQCTVKCP
jgi:hypothetical protein